MRFFGKSTPKREQVSEPATTKSSSLLARLPHQLFSHRPDEGYVKRDFKAIARAYYMSNAVGHQCVTQIANAISSIRFQVVRKNGDRFPDHPLLELLDNPSPGMAGSQFFFRLTADYLLAGNSYIGSDTPSGRAPNTLKLYRPDHIILNQTEAPWAYEYRPVEGQTLKRWPIDPVTDLVRDGSFFHIRSYNPLDEYRGLAASEAASYPGDNFNMILQWNKSILRNSGAGSLVIEKDDELPDDKFEEILERLTMMADAQKKGGVALLDGGLKMKDLGKTPKDMDFVQALHSMSRNIALAYGVPPQLLGIPGDNTYQNFKEARSAFFVQTIMPLARILTSSMNSFLGPRWDFRSQGLLLEVDEDAVTALIPQRLQKAEMTKNSPWLTVNEARYLTGEQSLPDDDPRGNMLLAEIGKGINTETERPEKDNNEKETD